MPTVFVGLDGDPRRDDVAEVPLSAAGPLRASVTERGWYSIAICVRQGSSVRMQPCGAVLVDGAAEVTARLDRSVQSIEEFLQRDD